METWLGTFRCTFSLLFIFFQQMIFPALWKLIGCVILAILLVATSIAVPPALLLSGSATTTPPGTTDLITTIPTTIDPMTTNQTQLQQHKILLNWYIHSSIYYSFFLILLLCNYVTGCIPIIFLKYYCFYMGYKWLIFITINKQIRNWKCNMVFSFELNLLFQNCPF